MIRIGVIGIDDISVRYLKVLKKIEGFEISGIYGRKWEEAKKIANDFGIPLFYEPEELIEFSDALTISGECGFYDLVVKSVKHAKNVFLNCPGFYNIEDSERLLKLVREAEVKVQVASLNPGSEALRASIPYIKNPLFIEMINHYSLNEIAEGFNINRLMVYDLNLLLSIMKSSVKRIYSSGFSIRNVNTDAINVRIEFGNGCIANYTISRFTVKQKHEYLIYQKKEIVSVNLRKNTSDLYLTQELNNKLRKKNIFNVTSFNKTANLMKKEIIDFFGFVEEGKPPLINLEDNHYSLQLIFDIENRINRTKIQVEPC